MIQNINFCQGGNPFLPPLFIWVFRTHGVSFQETVVHSKALRFPAVLTRSCSLKSRRKSGVGGSRNISNLDLLPCCIVNGKRCFQKSLSHSVSSALRQAQFPICKIPHIKIATCGPENHALKVDTQKICVQSMTLSQANQQSSLTIDSLPETRRRTQVGDI